MRFRSVRHVVTHRSLARTTVLVASLAVSTVLPAQPLPLQSPDVDTAAVQALRRMGAQLRTLQRFTVKAETERDVVTPGGQKVQVDGTFQYDVRRPNGLHADIKTDRKERQLFYDGRTLTVYAPHMNYYASTPAPSTIGAVVDTLEERLGIEMPIADLFRWGTERDGVRDITAAWYVGPASIEGVETDQYAFRQEGTDWQIWIQRGAQPLPRKIVVTTTSEPSQPQYVATLTWDVNARPADSLFTFTPPANAKRIRLRPAADVAAAEPPER